MTVLRISDVSPRPAAVPVQADPRSRPRVLYVCRAIAHFIYHETVIVALLRRGARVKVLFDEGWSSKKTIQFQDEALNAFRMRYPQVEIGWSVRRADRWREWIFPAREIRSYANYVRRGARTTEFYVNRWLGYVPEWVRSRRKNPRFQRLLTWSATDAALRLFERITPAAPEVMRHLREEKPDVIVVSPSNMRFSEEVEYVKAAKRLGIPVALHTMTWDNLSTKGVHHVVPDVVFLWNEIHFDDIREFHGFPEEICCIAGSPFLERWFDDGEPEDRAQLCRRMGIAEQHPYVIYLGSSKNIAKDEAWVVERIHARLRASNDPRLRRMSIVIRPHPANFDVFLRLKLDGVVIWPRGGALPQTADLHHEFRSMLAHATATIGINTTAMSDSLLADCPCLTPLLREYDRTQRLANHFKVLADRDVMAVCQDWRDIERNLTELLDGIDATRHRRRGFKAWFARPRGTDRSAGDVMAERIFGMVKPKVAARELPASAGGSAQWVADRIWEARADEAFRNYLDARDVACVMFDEAGSAPAAVSPWMDAGALTVTRLRAVLGGALGDRPEDYADGDPGHESAIRRLHATLADLDERELWVGEPAGLGQYGYAADTGLLNLSGAMIRYSLLTLLRAGFLGDFLKDKKRTLAIVGAGWGGTALAFASRFPNATVVVLDEPEGLLRTATYLRSVAPRLKLASATRSSLKSILPRLAELDVLLVPFYLADGLDAAPIDVAMLDAVVGTRDLAEPIRVLERLGASGCDRLCAVLNRRTAAKRLADTFDLETAEYEHLVDWPAWLAGLKEAGGDPEPVGAFAQLGHMVVRR
ncbi:hypothetical protein GCM10017083_22970 [Thalassobaculum fulvum]|uniref:Uncharacterized protein n=1 Tax=Thalassobaculum fulvum TaxID=1633335 RepID=A0A919CPG3_9PROT|nr:hypothetical protein [Thalassobaculum fulvum]GHD49957.1 hypothetical protein GCM10017083_22970 [Thalassobaculum fulvum]